MSRKSIITLHLALAAFFAPVLLVTGISGGLYLVEVKGSVEKQVLFEGELADFDFSSGNRMQSVQSFINNHNIDHDFEYLKGNSSTLVTRPTSKTHLSFEVKNNQLTVTKRSPNLIASIIELHKGHGPRLFKTFQKLMAIALFLILVSGLYLGLSSKAYVRRTLLISGAGVVSLLLLVWL